VTRARHPHRSGQSLVEFAVVALVMYLLLAAILTFGHALYVAQGLQSAADLAAREISRTPLSVNVESLDRDDEAVDYALIDDEIRRRIYDDAYLVIDLRDFLDNFTTPDGEQPNVFKHLVPQLPLLNQQLVTVMIVDRPIIDGVERLLLRYPGAVLGRDSLTPPSGVNYASWVASELTVGIPLVNRDGSIQWLSVVEEIETGNDNPFSVFNPDTNGIVALRMNYPFQSASMSSFQRDEDADDYPFESTVGRPNLADNSVSAPASQDGTPIEQELIINPESDNPIYAGTYGGNLGLGAQGALGQIVRPYRRVISAQAIYRREIFQ
jgi:hypothetical protein